MIGWMIYLTQGAMSPYVFGLSLALYAAGIILPISFLQGIGLGVFTCLVYVLACLAHAMEHGDAPFLVIGNAIFLSFSASISAGCTWFNERARMQLFRLQHEVSEKNAELISTNKALAEIKGHMMQQEKMAALGTLAAGLLHEVNNPVNYSLMALNMAQMDAAPLGSDMLKESLADAKEGMQRVQGIVSDLKTFAYQKPGDDASRIFLFEKALKSALRLTGFELKGVEVSTDLPMDSHVHGDEPAVIGVLINLLGNAALALHKSGRKTPKISVHAQRLEGRLQVAVRDNGTGITPENLVRVFEPFFTTREVGKGLGLGLSVSYAIINRHGGELRVASNPGEWTEFTFDLRLANLNA
jgi:two-component system sensor histidine kinase PhcS